MIKESELNTEIAIEEKQRQISEKQMESAVQEQQNQRKIRQLQMETEITIQRAYQPICQRTEGFTGLYAGRGFSFISPHRQGLFRRFFSRFA